MADKLGKHRICDACGERVFLEKVSFTHIPDHYVDPPEGWMHFEELGDLCPTCTNRLCLNIARIFGENVPKKFHKTTDPESEKLHEFYISFVRKVEHNENSCIW